MKTKVLLIFEILLVFFSSCCKDDYYLFDDDNWEYNQIYRSRMTKSNPEPQLGNAMPSVSDIIHNPDVSSMMGQAWQNMIASCCAEGRREYGFFIYFNYSNQTFVCGVMQNGDTFPYDVNAEFVMTGPSKIGGAQICASFHVHTSLYYAPDNYTRETGLSDIDSAVADTNNRPIIIYDYCNPVVDNTIPLNGDHQVYYYDPR